jgi:hypothetical protein
MGEPLGSPTTTTGWEEIGWSLSAFLLGVVALGAIRTRIRRTWLAVMTVIIEVLAGLSLVFLFEFAVNFRFFETPVDHRPAFYLAESAIWLTPLLALLQALAHRRAKTGLPTEPPPHAEESVPLEGSARPDAEELVLIIHGTGSARPSDAGEAWWQDGGAFARELESRLPSHMRVHRAARSKGPAEVFHWSGRNRESDRRAAGLALANHLERLVSGKTEDDGKRGAPEWRKVHLVAHSHGGSVVWQALRELLSRRSGMSGVGTVVTLGTPFLRPAPNDTVWFALGLLSLSAAFLWSIRKALLDAWAVGIEAWQAPVSLGIALVLFAVVAISAACITELVRVVENAARCHRERKRDLEVWRQLRTRVCCVHSPSDEAINGLAAAIAAEGGLFVSSAQSRGVRSLWREPVLTLYDDIVGPILDQAVWRRTSRRLQGLDLGGTRFLSSSPSPLDGAESLVLNHGVSERLDQWVSDHSADSLRRVRASLGVFWASGISVREIGRTMHKELVGKELVHWAYYQVPELIDGVSRLILDPTDRTIADSVPSPRIRMSRAQKELLGARFVSRGRWAGILTSAAVLAVLATLISFGWWRTNVYPLTDRFQAAAAVRSAPDDKALQAGQLDALARWIYAREDRVSLLRQGTAADLRIEEASAPGSTDYLLVSRRIGAETAPRFFETCKALYDLALGRASASEVVDLIEDAHSARVRRPLDGYLSEGEATDLTRKLRSEGAAFLRSCRRFRPTGAFFLEPERRYPAPWFGKREDNEDNKVGAALYLARAWAGDDRFLDEIAFALDGSEDATPRRIGVRTARAELDKIERTAAWAAADLIAALLAYKTPRADQLAERVLRRELDIEPLRLDFIGRELCSSRGVELVRSVEPALRSEARELLSAALRRCRVPSQHELAEAQRNVESRGEGEFAYITQDLRILAEHPGILVGASSVRRLIQLPQADPGSESLCDALALLARAGGFREARLRSEVCTPADRLDVLTEIVLGFRREQPDFLLSAVITEADRVVPAS